MSIRAVSYEISRCSKIDVHDQGHMIALRDPFLKRANVELSHRWSPRLREEAVVQVVREAILRTVTPVVCWLRLFPVGDLAVVVIRTEQVE